jgi:nucleotide-binding universal stress UspA family protein
VVALARRYGITIKTAVRAGASAETAIIDAARESTGLIVMGANRRAGSPLYLGEVATSVLQGSEASVVLLTS